MSLMHLSKHPIYMVLIVKSMFDVYNCFKTDDVNCIMDVFVTDQMFRAQTKLQLVRCKVCLKRCEIKSFPNEIY